MVILTIFHIFWSWRMRLKSIFQNVNVPAATMVILMIFDNVMVMKNMLKLHFSKCKCLGSYNGDPYNEIFPNVLVMAKLW